MEDNESKKNKGVDIGVVMRNNDGVVSAIYQKIAIDIAKNISGGKYAEGQKLSGRSILSSHYNVSPETIRKAVHILKDVGIVDTEKGSGVEIISADKAKEFIKRFEEVQSISAVKHEVLSWVKKQEKEMVDMIEKVKFIASAAERVKVYNPFTPYEIVISKDSQVLNMTINESKIWQKTGATIIAIKREDGIIISPGPYATFLLDDIIYIISTDQSYAVAKNFME